MKIVITDGYTLNPGDLDWRLFEQFGELSCFDRTSADDVMDRCRHADIILTNKTPIGKDVINGASNLKIIAVTATGFNVVDIQAAAACGVMVCNVPGYGTDSVAQHAFALLLDLSNHVCLNSMSVRAGNWSDSPDWCFSKAPIVELKDKVLGLVGFGKIGQQMARIGEVFGMRVIFHSRTARPADPRYVSLEKTFAESDFVSVHCPLTPEIHSFIDAKLLSSMKPGAFLINTARGQLIHEMDLAVALKRGYLKGAALDVLAQEPPPSSHPLIGLENCLITPHNAWMSLEARGRIMHITFENIRQALAGNPQNVIGP